MSGRFGPRWVRGQGTTFRLWAPAAAKVDLMVDGDASMAMPASGNGWFEITRPSAGPGTRYKFRIDGEVEVPDPASHFQPDDVNGPSEIVDHDFDWQAREWRGRPWLEAVTLELHVGTFTPEGQS